jgi:hypothetical protein
MAFQVYYPIAEIGARLAYTKKWVTRRVQAGDFGPIADVIQVGKDIRVPQSGIDFFIEGHPYKRDAATLMRNKALLARRLEGRKIPPDRGPFSPGISARSPGELRRKLAVKTFSS